MGLSSNFGPSSSVLTFVMITIPNDPLAAGLNIVHGLTSIDCCSPRLGRRSRVWSKCSKLAKLVGVST